MGTILNIKGEHERELKILKKNLNLKNDSETAIYTAVKFLNKHISTKNR